MDDIDLLFYNTTDPRAALNNCPASTTLLFTVCGNDPAKFEEACRLVRLFVEKDRETRK